MFRNLIQKFTNRGTKETQEKGEHFIQIRYKGQDVPLFFTDEEFRRAFRRALEYLKGINQRIVSEGEELNPILDKRQVEYDPDSEGDVLNES